MFLSRTLLGSIRILRRVLQTPLLFPCLSPNLLFSCSCFSELAPPFIHPSLKNPNPKCRCPPPFPCQISHQVSLVIPLLTPKAVPFSPSLLFYFGPLYSLLKLSQKPRDKVQICFLQNPPNFTSAAGPCLNWNFSQNRLLVVSTQSRKMLQTRPEIWSIRPVDREMSKEEV